MGKLNINTAKLEVYPGSYPRLNLDLIHQYFPK